MAQLAGDGYKCENISGGTMGTDLDGTSYVRSLGLNASGGYTYSVLFFSGPCSGNGINGTGDNYMTYSQGGTYTVDGAATGVANATKVSFTITSASLTVRPTYTLGGTVRSYADTRCSPLDFDDNAVSTRTVNNVSCVVTPSMSLGSFPQYGAGIYNIVSNPGNTTLSIGSRMTQWYPGMGGYPTSYSETYLTW